MIFEAAAGALAKALTTRLIAGQPGAVRARQDRAALERAIGAAWAALSEDHRAALARYDVNLAFFEHEGAEEIARIFLPGRGPSAERLALAYARGLGQRETPPSEPLVAAFDAFLENFVEELGRHAAFRTILADVAVTRVAYGPRPTDVGDSPTGSAGRHRGGPRTVHRRQMFVVMPFGSRLDQARGRTLDFDSLYHEIIGPAAEQADWTATRIDDVVEPGVIADQYLRAIVNADLVLADISIPNGNVYYELGIRHAVSAGGTLLIALAGTQIPFDLSAHRVLFYEESDDARAQLRDRITDALIGFVPRTSSNPVRDFLERMGFESSPDTDGVAFERDLSARVERARNREQLIAVWEWARPFPAVSAAPLQELASCLADVKEWSIAADILATALVARPGDFEIHRQRGWYLQQLGEARDTEAAAAFERALELNRSDPETLGMMAGRLKRLGDLRGAAGLYRRAADVSPNSTYIAVNRAACELLLDPEHPEAGTALYHQLAERLFQEYRERPFDEWDEIVLGEALFAIGDDEGATTHYATATQLASSTKALESAAGQLRLFERAGFRSAAAARLRTLLQGASEGERAPAVATEKVEAARLEARSGPIIIHLSDVHFAGRDEMGAKDARHRFYAGPDSLTLLQELEDEFVAKGAGIDLDRARIHIVVSGDLAWTASEEEFGQALELLEGLTAMLGLSKERVHLVPGNHDVNWGLATAERDRRLDNYVRLIARFYGEHLASRRYPFISWPIKITDAAPAPHELLGVAVDADNGVLICGLNSCVLEDEQHHFGYVGRNQIRALKRYLSTLDLPQGLVRVAVMHHHLHPFPEYVLSRDRGDVYLDISVVRDAGVLERELEQLGFDLVLHGHKHKPQLRETRVREIGQQKEVRPALIVCGAGSVSCTELEHAQSNQYEIVDVLRARRERGVGFVRIVWRELPLVSGAEWTTTQAWTIEG